MADSSTTSLTYTIMLEQVATPTANLPTGVYTDTQYVTLSCATSGVTIRFTTDGSEPTSASRQYSGSIPVKTTTTIKAKAFKSGMAESESAMFTYTFRYNLYFEFDYYYLDEYYDPDCTFLAHASGTDSQGNPIQVVDLVYTNRSITNRTGYFTFWQIYSGNVTATATFSDGTVISTSATIYCEIIPPTPDR